MAQDDQIEFMDVITETDCVGCGVSYSVPWKTMMRTVR